MSRLPVRVRLTAVFVAAMAAILAGLGFLLVDHLAASLDRTLDQGLRARATDVSALIQQADTGLQQAHITANGATTSFAQVLDTQGRIVDETRGLGSQPLLGAAQLRHARSAPLLVGRVRRLGSDVRLLATPVHAQDRQLVIVVGDTLRQRDQALATLHRELFIGGPLALVAVALLGYLLAAGALRPVERIRARADAISERDLSQRLPVPHARDELARLGETLNTMLARIERAMNNERTFVADASHELRSPLALIRTEVELALEQPRSPTELQAALQSIGEEADRLSQLTEDLLLLARLDEGQLPLRQEPFEVRALLENVATRFQRRAHDAGRTIDIDAADLQIYGDRLRLEQALANLLENALRHGDGNITLSTTETADAIRLHVTDHGPGFPPDFLPQAFTRFSRADNTRPRTGTGLGLAIVSEIANAHSGTATATNTPESGADVWLSLPRTTPAQQAAASSA
jgi:heavy metal sensor kinase